jgi:UDP-glucose 4-epimerase
VQYSGEVSVGVWVLFRNFFVADTKCIDAARKVTSHSIPTEVKERRAVDYTTLIASSDKTMSVLGCKPRFD